MERSESPNQATDNEQTDTNAKEYFQQQAYQARGTAIRVEIQQNSQSKSPVTNSSSDYSVKQHQTPNCHQPSSKQHQEDGPQADVPSPFVAAEEKVRNSYDQIVGLDEESSLTQVMNVAELKDNAINGGLETISWQDQAI